MDTGLDIPEFLHASNAIFRRSRFVRDGVHIYHIPPLAQGYGLLSCRATGGIEDVRSSLTALLDSDKTVVIENVTATFVELLCEIVATRRGLRLVEVVDRNPYELNLREIRNPNRTYSESTFFILSEDYILRRFFHQAAQAKNMVYRTQRHSPPQAVTFVGVGPSPTMLTNSVIQTIQRASHLVLFDRTLENIILDVPLPI